MIGHYHHVRDSKGNFTGFRRGNFNFIPINIALVTSFPEMTSSMKSADIMTSLLGVEMTLSVSTVFLALLLPKMDAEISVSQISDRVVVTQFGRLRGFLVNLPSSVSRGQSGSGKTNHVTKVEIFYGIQYASVLGGQLRFMPPTGPMEKWGDVRSATRRRPVCPQPIPDISAMEREGRITYAELERWKSVTPFLGDQHEECLYLNIYVPERG